MRRVYVKVVVQIDESGGVRPLSVTWEDGRTFEVDRLLDVRRAASTKVGGQGIRYTCQVGERIVMLFYDAPYWFIEREETEKSPIDNFC